MLTEDYELKGNCYISDGASAIKLGGDKFDPLKVTFEFSQADPVTYAAFGAFRGKLLEYSFKVVEHGSESVGVE